MAAPAPMTNLEVERVDGAPVDRITFDHTGVDLDRIEIKYQFVDSETQAPQGNFITYTVADASDLHVSGNSYQLDAVAIPNVRWVVRAINTAGEVSV